MRSRTPRWLNAIRGSAYSIALPRRRVFTQLRPNPDIAVERTLGLGLQRSIRALNYVMERDIKDIIGVLMCVLDGGEISHEELDDLAFEADGELETALNEAYVKLWEFANDRNVRLNDLKMDRNMRSELKECLDNIVKACDLANGTPD
jgi:hypothetical protein